MENKPGPFQHHRFFLVLTLYLSIATVLPAQTGPVDSLKMLVAAAPDDSVRIERMSELINEFFRINVDSAFYYSTESMRLARALNSPFLIAKCENNLGVCYYYKGDFTEAMSHYMNSLTIRRAIRHEIGISSTLGNIAILQMEMGKPDEALVSFREILAAEEQRRDSMEIARALFHIGNCLYSMPDLPGAVEYLKKAAAMFKTVSSDLGYAIASSNLASCYADMKDIKNSRIAYEESLKSLFKLQDNQGISIACDGLGGLAVQEGDYPIAIRHFRQAIAYSRLAGSAKNEATFYKNLSNAYTQAGDLKEALAALERHAVLNDSLSKAIYNQDVAEMQTKYETEKKEAAIRDLQNQNRIQELRILRRNLLVAGACIGLSALAVLLILARRTLRQKQRLNEQQSLLHQRQLEQLETQKQIDMLNAQMEGQQKERLRVAEDLHDDFGSGLSKISLMAQVLQHQTTEKWPELDKISAAARELLLKMNEIVWTLNYRNDTLPGLAAYLRRYTAQYFENTPVRCFFEIPHELPERAVEGTLRRTVFLLLKEALHNVLKHAQASKVVLLIQPAAGQGLHIRISDNGKGFSTTAPAEGGNGLVNMQSRLQQIGGTFSVQSAPGGGTVLSFSIPV